MSPKLARIFGNTLLIAGVILMLMIYRWPPFGIIGFAVFAAGIVPQVLWNRCPHCGLYLGKKVGKTCRFCGKDLNEKPVKGAVDREKLYTEVLIKQKFIEAEPTAEELTEADSNADESAEDEFAEDASAEEETAEEE